MEMFELIFDFMHDVFSKLNSVELVGVPLGIILISFVITSIIISVFWKGGRG